LPPPAPGCWDDAAALAARQRLAPLLPGISDPFLHAVARLAMAWTLPVAGDYGGTLREAAVSLEELRGQDEPVFTAMAALTAGAVEMALGRYDDALRHLREARDLAEQAGGDWLAAGARVQLGTLAVLRGSLDEARPLLEGALDLSLAARSTSFVTLCLAGYAWLAFADGDPDRAALLEGAAEGLRRRVGLSAWPHLRKAEADLVAQVRQKLGTARFDRAFSAGSGLTQQQAVALVRDQRGTGTETPLATTAHSAEAAACRPVQRRTWRRLRGQPGTDGPRWPTPEQRRTGGRATTGSGLIHAHVIPDLHATADCRRTCQSDA
jgi:tetratricopeptide (TPR) repeat protein